MSTAPVTDVSVRFEAAVAVVTLSAPPANALGAGLAEAFGQAVRDLQESEARAVVVESSIPRYFAVGADLKFAADLDAAGFDAYLSTVTDAFRSLEHLPVPTVAAISGFAVGGGLELALACSFRIAGSSAQLGLPEIRLGLLPGAGGTQRLPRLVGRAVALDLLLSGRVLTAKEALAVHLVDSVVPADEVHAAAMAAARKLAEMPKDAVAAILRCVSAADSQLEAGLAAEAREIRTLFATDDAREGIAAFLERREPRFL